MKIHNNPSNPTTDSSALYSLTRIKNFKTRYVGLRTEVKKLQKNLEFATLARPPLNQEERNKKVGQINSLKNRLSQSKEDLEQLLLKKEIESSYRNIAIEHSSDSSRRHVYTELLQMLV